MALVPNFTASESLGLPEQVQLTDTSTGSDGAIASRRVSFRLANGNYLIEPSTTVTTETFVAWNLADTTKVFTILSKSQAVSITVQWLDAGGVVLYEKVILWDFDLYDYLYGWELLQYQTTKPEVVNDQDYYGRKIKLIVNIWDSENATLFGDIYSAQAALDRDFYLMNNEQFWFGVNN